MPAENLRMALVARPRLIHGHGQSLGPVDVRVGERHRSCQRHIASRMRIVAVGARDPEIAVSRGMPCHGRRSALMAFKAQVLARALANLAVRIVARGAVETVRTANLVRAGNHLKFLHVAVALVANVGGDSVEVVRCSLKRDLLRGLLVSHESNSGRSGPPDRRSRIRGRRSAGRDVVVGRVTVHARQAFVSMNRKSPLGTWFAGVIFMAFQAQFRRSSGIHGLEVVEHTLFLATRFQVSARRPVARFARLSSMDTTVDVVLHRFRVGLMARQAQFVVVDVLSAFDFRNRYLKPSVGSLVEEIVRLRHTRRL